jgi:hypothetical protein
MPRRIVQTVIPADAVFRCTAVARTEGKPEKGGLRVSVPAPVVRGLMHMGWGGKWLHVRLDGARWIAAVRPHPTATMFALPKWCRGDIAAGDAVELELFDAERARCRSTGFLDEEQNLVDWAAVVPADAFPIEEPNGVLAVHTRYEPPFRLLRRAPVPPTLALLDAYAGDAQAGAWQAMRKDRAQLNAIADVLEKLGINGERIEIRPRGDAFALRIEASRPFVQMTVAAQKETPDGQNPPGESIE